MPKPQYSASSEAEEVYLLKVRARGAREGWLVVVDDLRLELCRREHVLALARNIDKELGGVPAQRDSIGGVRDVL